MSWSIAKDIISWGMAFYRRPRMRVYFDKNKTYHTARDLNFNNLQGMFVHVMVENQGNSVARAVRGLLTEVLKEGPGGAFTPAQGFRNPVELHWAHENLDVFCKDIPAHDEARLDVCYAHQGYSDLRFFCDKRPRGIQTDFPPSRYRIAVTVRAVNASSVTRKFLIAWNGNYKDLYMEELM